MEAPSTDQIRRHLRHANRVAQAAMNEGRQPFGAVLVAPDNETVLLEQGNLDAVNHAEATLARRAADQFDSEYLWNCTLYSTAEPCAMCAATQYWANIGKLVYGITERQLLALTGANSENPPMDLPCRTIFAHGQKAIQVWGPVDDLLPEISELHRNYWD